MEGISIRAVEPRDSTHWERMRQALWPSPAGEHASEIDHYLHGDRRNPAAVLMAFDEAGRAIGFAELSLRSYAEGCTTSRVGYLEGWFVDPTARRKGVGTALLKAAEGWARAEGCTEFGSDAEIDNDVSIAAHKALGFEEVDRVVCFRKSL